MFDPSIMRQPLMESLFAFGFEIWVRVAENIGGPLTYMYTIAPPSATAEPITFARPCLLLIFTLSILQINSTSQLS